MKKVPVILLTMISLNCFSQNHTPDIFNPNQILNPENIILQQQQRIQHQTMNHENIILQQQRFQQQIINPENIILQEQQRIQHQNAYLIFQAERENAQRQ